MKHSIENRDINYKEELEKMVAPQLDDYLNSD